MKTNIAINVGIIGSGNIGTDLLLKIRKEKFLYPSIFVGRRADSEGLKLGKALGVLTSTLGIDFFRQNPNYCKVVFDCTNAHDAIENYKVFKEQGIKVIDMTPAKLGEMCVPTINSEKIKWHDNVNMITCGGQASLPLLHEIAKASETNLDYIEIVSQVSSKSAGMATRSNIDQYIQTTETAIYHFTGCKSCKVILNLNPAVPEVDMQTTMFIDPGKVEIPFDTLLDKLTTKIKEVKSYSPHYEMTMIPVVNEAGIIILSVKVKGAADFLPSYAGNLDIINCAAIRVAQELIYEQKNLN
jgi:acetaldehyde dehydrogenase (acetylating)